MIPTRRLTHPPPLSYAPGHAGWPMRDPTPQGICPATAADLNGIAGLFVRVFRSPPYAEQWEFSIAHRYLGDLIAGSAGIAFTVPGPDGTSAGFILGACHGVVRAMVYEIAVDDRFRQRGIGSALLDRFIEEARSRGAREIELLARRDLPAYRFYRRRGFRSTRRMILMIRTLEPASRVEAGGPPPA